jgi:hypothetical protein
VCPQPKFALRRFEVQLVSTSQQDLGSSLQECLDRREAHADGPTDDHGPFPCILLHLKSPLLPHVFHAASVVIGQCREIPQLARL